MKAARKNVSIDWTIKENVRAKMKVAVKRLLRKYGYPPDMQKLVSHYVSFPLFYILLAYPQGQEEVLCCCFLLKSQKA